MNNIKTIQIFSTGISFLLLIMLVTPVWSQSGEPELNRHFSGKIFATQNGISNVPSFSLDKPAVLINLSFGGDKFTVEPDMRFPLEDGKPWAFIFWLRYKAINNDEFKLRVGAHPAYNFRTISAVSNGKSKDLIEARRFLAGEVAPTFVISDKVQIGTYYLYAIGLDDSNRHTHFILLNSSIPGIKLSEDLNFGLFPGVFYLKMDELDGYYFTSSFRLSKKDFPIAFESIISNIIDSEILPDRKFIWNLSLVYSFNKKFAIAK